MKVTRCLVYAYEYGAIDIEVEVSPIGAQINWRECEIAYFDDFPVINYGEWEEPIPLEEDGEPLGIPTSAEEMLNYVIYDGIQQGSLVACDWVTLAEY